MIQATGNVTLGESQRDKEYALALNWDGKTPLRGFDLAGRDLSGIDLQKADLTRANLSGADLQGAELTGADLREARLANTKLQGAVYNASTIWPDGYSPPDAARKVE